MATPGNLPIVFYDGASHDLVITLSVDFDLSSYTDFVMKLYHTERKVEVAEIDLTRDGSQLSHTFSVEDIQGYPEEMRHEILFIGGSDTDPILRGDATVTDVLHDDSISTGAEVTITDDSVVVTVEIVKGEKGETGPQGPQGDPGPQGPAGDPIDKSSYTVKGDPVDADDIVGFDSENADNPIIIPFSSFEGGVYDPILTAEGYNDIIIYERPNRADGDLNGMTADSGQTWSVMGGTMSVNSNTIIVSNITGSEVVAELDQSLNTFAIDFALSSTVGGAEHERLMVCFERDGDRIEMVWSDNRFLIRERVGGVYNNLTSAINLRRGSPGLPFRFRMLKWDKQPFGHQIKILDRDDQNITTGEVAINSAFHGEGNLQLVSTIAASVGTYIKDIVAR